MNPAGPVLVSVVLIGLGAVLGACLGSFLNVVIYRVPRGMSVAYPPSACPSCEVPVAWRDNIPVVSWLLLRGRCRSCGVSIGALYPAVEVAGAAAAGLLVGLVVYAPVAYALGLALGYLVALVVVVARLRARRDGRADPHRVCPPGSQLPLPLRHPES